MNTNYSYENIVSANQIFNNNIDRWRFLYRSYVGGDEYRDAGYLTRYALETDKEYAARCKETPLDNHCASVISVYNSFLFRKSPDREFGQLEVLPELADFLKDADLDGRSLNAFMREVNTWSNVFGHAWVIMSKPNVNAVTRADELALGVRPYVSILTPLVVTDWKFERSANGRYELTYFKYVEDVNGSVQVVREWTRDEIITTIVDTEGEELSEQVIEPNALGVIPAVICYNQRGVTRGVGVSSINDIADLQRYLYNAYSEAAQSVRLDSHPSLVTTPDTQVGTGSGSIITIPENLDPGLKPYVLDFAGASIDAILKIIDNGKNAIETMANLGGVRATQSSSMSGVALETEFQLLNARLAQMADNMELCEEQLWRLFCMYQGQPYTVEVDYPSSFSMRDTKNEISQLQAAKSAATDPRVLAAIDSKIIDWLEPDEDEITFIMNPDLIDIDAVPESKDYYIAKDMIEPVSGEIRTVITAEEELALAKQGWVTKDVE